MRERTVRLKDGRFITEFDYTDEEIAPMEEEEKRRDVDNVLAFIIPKGPKP